MNKLICGIECKLVPGTEDLYVGKCGTVFLGDNKLTIYRNVDGSSRITHGIRGITTIRRRLMALTYIPCTDANGKPADPREMRAINISDDQSDDRVDNLRWTTPLDVYRMSSNNLARAIAVYYKFDLDGDIDVIVAPSDIQDTIGANRRTIHNGLSKTDPFVTDTGYIVSYSKEAISDKVEYTPRELRARGTVKLDHTGLDMHLHEDSLHKIHMNPEFAKIGISMSEVRARLPRLGSDIADGLSISFVINGKEYRLETPPDGEEHDFDAIYDHSIVYVYDAVTNTNIQYSNMHELCKSVPICKKSAIRSARMGDIRLLKPHHRVTWDSEVKMNVPLTCSDVVAFASIRLIDISGVAMVESKSMAHYIIDVSNAKFDTRTTVRNNLGRHLTRMIDLSYRVEFTFAGKDVSDIVYGNYNLNP